MKLILGYIVRNEEAMLRLTLPVMIGVVDAIVAIDACSQDGTADTLRKCGAAVVERPWNGSFSAARNACIGLAEQLYPSDYMLMLDADEAMLSRDVLALRATIATSPTAFSLPRYEFVDDFAHFNPKFYPDYQARCFPLSAGYRYGGYLHEQLQPVDHNPLPFVHIFHYGKCKSIPECALKYENYNRFNRGEPPLERLADDYPLPESFSQGIRLTFHGETPL